MRKIKKFKKELKNIKILNLTRLLCLCVLVGLFYDVQCFTAQNIDVTVNINADVAGNGDANNNGIAPFNQSPIGNTITINSFVTGNVYGSYGQGTNIEVSSNCVNVTQLGNVNLSIYGALVSAASDQTIIASNKVIIKISNGNCGGWENHRRAYRKC